MSPSRHHSRVTPSFPNAQAAYAARARADGGGGGHFFGGAMGDHHIVELARDGARVLDSRRSRLSAWRAVAAEDDVGPRRPPNEPYSAAVSSWRELERLDDKGKDKKDKAQEKNADRTDGARSVVSSSSEHRDCHGGDGGGGGGGGFAE